MNNGNAFASHGGNYSGRGGKSHGSPTRSGWPLHEGSPHKKKKLGPKPFKWGDTTFMVPRRLEPTASQNEKHLYLTQTSRALRDQESSSWTDKAHAFTLRFNYQTTHRQAQLKFIDLKGQVHTNCYNFLYIGCAREDFITIAIPAVGGLTANFQNSCAFIACRVTVNPLQAWAGLNNPPTQSNDEYGYKSQKKPPPYLANHNSPQASTST
jgi:hypothetical protein